MYRSSPTRIGELGDGGQNQPRRRHHDGSGRRTCCRDIPVRLAACPVRHPIDEQEVGESDGGAVVAGEPEPATEDAARPSRSRADGFPWRRSRTYIPRDACGTPRLGRDVGTCRFTEVPMAPQIKPLAANLTGLAACASTTGFFAGVSHPSREGWLVKGASITSLAPGVREVLPAAVNSAGVVVGKIGDATDGRPSCSTARWTTCRSGSARRSERLAG
jgi:hypothetical protein